MTEGTPGEPIEWVKHYVETLADMRRQMGVERDWKFNSVEEFTLHYGKEFVPAPLPPYLQEYRGALKMCYANSYESLMQLLAEGYEELTYAEGYAHGLITTHHAWLTDGERAFDLTWEPGHGKAYFGVAYDPAWYEDFVFETNHCSVLGIDFTADKAQIQLLREGLPPEAIYDC